MEIFAPRETIKRRLREMLLTLLIIGNGFFAASELNSIAASLVTGALSGVSMMFFPDSLWPSATESGENQWFLFFAILVIPCALASGGLLAYALHERSVTDTFFAALLLAAILYSPVQVWRISKRDPE